MDSKFKAKHGILSLGLFVPTFFIWTYNSPAMVAALIVYNFVSGKVVIKVGGEGHDTH
jgi:hypothetical protein